MEKEQLEIGDVVLKGGDKMTVICDGKHGGMVLVEDRTGYRHRLTDDNWKPYEVSHGLWGKEILFLKRLHAFMTPDKFRSFEVGNTKYMIFCINTGDTNCPVKIKKMYPVEEHLSWKESREILSDLFFKKLVRLCKFYEVGFCKRYKTQVECDAELPPCEFFEMSDC